MSSHLTPPVSSRDHVQGNKKAPLTLVEFGDYQCIYCGHAYPIIKQVQQKMGNRLKFVFRNFPLSEAHPDAFNAAVAAEAAALQNKFWEMHDTLYEHQEQLDWEHLFLYAKTSGLDLERFKADIEEESVSARVEADFESGVRSGVNGTPSFFINEEKYDGDWGGHDLFDALNRSEK